MDRLSDLLPGSKEASGENGGGEKAAAAEAEAASLKPSSVQCGELTGRACRSDPRCFWKGRANNPELAEGVCRGARTYCEGRQTVRSCRGSADGSFNCAWEPAERACLAYGRPPAVDFMGSCMQSCSNWEDCLAPDGSRSGCSECRRGRCERGREDDWRNDWYDPQLSDCFL